MLIFACYCKWNLHSQHQKTSPCYQYIFHAILYIYDIVTVDPPQESEGGALQQVGIRNNRYCLGCQLESNPPPTCNWTVYSFSVPPSPLSCYWDPRTCDVVSDPPGGVSFPHSPEDECNDVCDDTSQLPPPVYPGCACYQD